MIRSVFKVAVRSAKPCLLMPTAFTSVMINYSLTQQPVYHFAKITKKQKDKQKSDQQKKKMKQQIGDTSTFDLNPFEQKYKTVIQNLKHAISLYKVGRLDPAMLNNIYVKIGNNSVPISQAAQIAPKSANSCVLNAFDQDNLEAIQKAIQMSDMGFQISRIDKTIHIVQPPNSMKQIKDKMLEKLKKNSQNFKQKMGKVRNEARDELKKYKKIIPEQRYKVIEKQLNTLYEKQLTQLENTIKDKQKQLKK